MRPPWHSESPWPVEGDAPFARLAKGVTGALDFSGRVICAVCLAGMFGALLSNVVLRYAAGSGFGWAYEIHAVLLPWLVGGGIVVAAAQGRHIAITLLQDALPPGATRWLLLFIQITVVVIAVSVLWTSQPILAAARFQRIPSLGITQSWGYFSLVYAFGGMAAIAALDTVRLALGERFGATGAADNSLS